MSLLLNNLVVQIILLHMQGYLETTNILFVAKKDVGQ